MKAFSALEQYTQAPTQFLSFKFGLIYFVSLALLIIASKVQIPMFPVPMTFQTAAILLIPALYGMRLGVSVLLSWLALGTLGLPVFASALAAPGFAYFFGPTGGYFVGFIAATVIAAYALHHKRVKGSIKLFMLFLSLHGLILFTGWVWLAYGLPQLGAQKAMITGVTPFLIGAVIKTMIVTGLVAPTKKS